MNKIKIGYLKESGHSKFGDFENWYHRLIDRNFDVEWVDYKKADFVLFSEKNRNQKVVFKIPHKAIRIFLTGENVRPNFNEADFALTHDYIENPRHIRLPELRHWLTGWETKPRNWEVLSKNKTRFCNFMYSNSIAQERITFFRELSKYRRVDSAGKVLNNMEGGYIENKSDFLNNYKFTIAFENSSFPGYSTEKLIHPLMVGSIPIYWGDTEIEKDINPDCFINVHNYRSFDEVIDRIKEIDADSDLWRKYVTSPILKDNTMPEHFKEEQYIQYFDRIFTGRRHQISPLKKYIQTITYHLENIKLFRKL